MDERDGRLKEIVYIVLTIIGVIVVCVVTYINYNPSNDNKVFGVGAYYVPETQVSKSDQSSALLYQQLMLGKQKSCPATTLQRSKGAISISGLYSGSGKDSKYNLEYFFLGTDMTTGKNNIGSMEDLKGAYGLHLKQECLSTTGPIKIGELMYGSNLATEKSYEIIAPFDFQFGNINTDANNAIVIISKDGSCNITFSNVINWFCAGELPESTDSNIMTDEVLDWWYHNKNHNTIIGSSNNADVRTGKAGVVIGYCNADTEITIQKLEDDVYVNMTIEDLLELNQT